MFKKIILNLPNNNNNNNNIYIYIYIYQTKIKKLKNYEQFMHWILFDDTDVYVRDKSHNYFLFFLYYLYAYP